MLDGYTLRANIARYRELLSASSEDEQRQTLEWLLAREMDRLSQLERAAADAGPSDERLRQARPGMQPKDRD
jgi:hypothetical protein